MSKQNFYCVIDCGFSKLRFSVFSSDLENIFSETISTKFQLDDPNYFIEIKKLIKLINFISIKIKDGIYILIIIF